jgi:hypothetical protein
VQTVAERPDGVKLFKGEAWALQQSVWNLCRPGGKISYKKDGKIKVHRIAAAGDCGPTVNPGPIVEQIKEVLLSP